MKLEKLTPLLVVPRIEPCLSAWEAMGYRVSVRVPDSGRLGFVILKSKTGELMLQSTASFAEDLPAVAKRKPSTLFYADVASVTEAKKALRGAKVLVPRRKTFYGATESWLELENKVVIGLSEHA